jgi:hypothetical protein
MRISPRFSTAIADHVTGRSLRRAAFAFASYGVELEFNGLRGDSAEPDLQAISGFFSALGGRYAPFWFAPPGLASVAGQSLGYGDGEQCGFPLQRSVGGYTEPVAGASSVSAVYVNGAPVSASAWGVTSGYAPVIQFAAPPAAGAIVSADFQPLWLCRFDDDQLESEEALALLFALRSVKLVSVRP